jgi:hypothetical protein
MNTFLKAVSDGKVTASGSRSRERIWNHFQTARMAHKIYIRSSWIVIYCLFSCHPNHRTEEIPVIRIGEAMESVSDFSLSAIADEISFVVLETTDRSLIGNYPDIAVWKDKIVVSSQNQPLLVFDRKDGHFCNTIGHFGDDPEGCGNDGFGNIPFGIDRTNGTVYLRALGDIHWLRYDLNGRFLGRVKPDMGKRENYRFNFSYFLVSNNTVTTHNKMWMLNEPYLTCFDGITGNLLDTIPPIVSPVLPVSEISNLSYLYGDYDAYGSMGVFIMEYRGDKVYDVFPGSPSLWEHDGQRYLKECFIDTVYTVGEKTLTPRLALDMGKWNWPYEKRFDRDGSGERISIDYMLENDNLIYFHFHTGLHEKQDRQQSHCGFYDKRSGETKVMKGDRIADDKYQFLPLTVRKVSSSGEFVGLIQAADVIEWKEKHAAIPDNRNLQSVLTMDSEDNPVVVLMK